MPRTLSIALLLLANVALAGAAFAAEGAASATLKDPDGKEVGIAKLTETPNGVLIALDVSGIPAGVHAFHVHAVGKCEGPDFKSAGPHFNPDDAKHGIMSQHGPHAGDMPNLEVPADGKLKVEVLNTLVRLKGENSVFDNDGAAVVIHAKADDYKTDPAGDAGDRVACGVLQQ